MCVYSVCVCGRWGRGGDAEGCQAFCIGCLYCLWQVSPTGPSGPWQNAAGPFLPPSWKLPPAKQIKRYPLPTRVSWKMTGRDILPSGHSQLKAINYTINGSKRKEPSGKILVGLSLLYIYDPRINFSQLYVRDFLFGWNYKKCEEIGFRLDSKCMNTYSF